MRQGTQWFAMRQRLLLVAGWVIAAVASSLVAAGAVAVAGGQVTDRPLRPLTAAEVAALPVARTVEAPVAASPMPPAAPATDQEVSAEGAPRRGPRLDDESGPAGDEGTLEGRSDVVLDPAAPSDERDEFGSADPAASEGSTLLTGGGSQGGQEVGPDPDRTVFLVSHTTGGSTGVTGRDGSVVAFFARPQPGFAVSHDFVSQSELVVYFTGTQSRWVVVARWAAGEFVVTETEQRG